MLTHPSCHRWRTDFPWDLNKRQLFLCNGHQDHFYAAAPLLHPQQRWGSGYGTSTVNQRSQTKWPYSQSNYRDPPVWPRSRPPSRSDGVWRAVDPNKGPDTASVNSETGASLASERKHSRAPGGLPALWWFGEGRRPFSLKLLSLTCWRRQVFVVSRSARSDASLISGWGVWMPATNFIAIQPIAAETFHWEGQRKVSSKI